METLEASAVHWDELAAKEDRWAAFLESGKATHTTERPAHYRGLARSYRNVALALRMEIKTGVAHCACTTPPHSRAKS